MTGSGGNPTPGETVRLQTTVEASSARQAYEIARQQGEKFFEIPPEAVKAVMLSARVAVAASNGVALVYEVEFEVYPVIIIGIPS